MAPIARIPAFQRFGFPRLNGAVMAGIAQNSNVMSFNMRLYEYLFGLAQQTNQYVLLSFPWTCLQVFKVPRHYAE